MARTTLRSRPKSSAQPEKVLSSPGPSMSTRRSLRSDAFIPNSSADDVDTPLEPIADPSRRLFEAVVIPSQIKGGATKMSESSTSSRLSTRQTSVEDDEEDTPGTSIATDTPAPRNRKGKSMIHANDLSVLTNEKRTGTSVVTEGKQRLDTTAQDAEIARQLQQDEYDDSDVVVDRVRILRGRRASQSARIEDSDLDSELTDLASLTESTSEDEPRAKRRRITRKAALPVGASSSRTSQRQRVKPINGSKRREAVIEEGDSTPPGSEDLFESDEEDLDFENLGSIIGSDSELSELSEDEAENTEEMSAATRQPPKLARRSKPTKRTLRRKQAMRQAGSSAEGEDFWSRKGARRRKLEKSHPEIKTLWKDLAKIPTITPVQAAQPVSITRRLKAFQLEGLDWMIKQERTHYKGGLLGDEMGMGKTIQAVSLIMSDHPAKEPTLVLVPPVALMQWANEIKEYTNGKLKVLVVHGTNKESKNLSTQKIRDHDVIMMSYNSLESMFRKQEKGWARGENIVKEDSPIHAVKFHRLILDEAHSIKSRTTGVAKACFALQGKYKWCLSGTPVQNRIGEFFSLLRFLEVRPFADYFCEACPCAELHWSIDADYYCKSCRHSASEHRSVFNEELLNPIIGDIATSRKEALSKLHMLTARVMLRRMKKDHVSSMELPPKEVVIHNEFFGEIERDFSSSIMSNTARQFDTYVSRGVMLNNYANIFGLIMQMRQVANHPDLLLKKHSEGGQNVLVCNICDEPAEEAIRSRCKHEFCRGCAKQYVTSCEGDGGIADCPRCHIPLVIDWEQPDIEQDEEQVKKSSIINRIKMENWTSSTKIEMLVYDLYKLRSRKRTTKSIVFSQFTSMLQLIEWRLRRAGFSTVMLDGSMTPIQRQRSIDFFMNNADVEVFLVSLKAGGVALNLTEASRVFIVDVFWNPAAEWQSADRCHRIGQVRPTVITRLCIEDSIESRIVQLQEKKAKMIRGTLDGDGRALEQLTPADMQFLFRGT